MFFTNFGIRRDAGRWSVAFILLLLAACGGSGGSGGATNPPGPPPPPASFSYQPPPDKGDLWQVAGVDAQGMSVESIEGMMTSVLNGEYPIIDSIAVAHRGKLVLHETVRTELSVSDGHVDNTDLEMHALFSVSKSIASIAVGINIDMGNVSDVDVSYLSLFPYPDIDNWDDRKNDITLHDVLTMRAGFEWNEWDPPYDDPDNQLFDFYDNHVDYSKGLLDLPLAADPGTQFAYNTVATVSLGQAIENTAPLALIDFSFANLLGPLGISNVEVIRTPTGLPDVGRGLYLTTRDLLKFGQLYLDGGHWNGEQIVSSEWVATSTQPYTDVSWPDPEAMDWQMTGYGYQWWTGHFEFEGRQIESFAAWGFAQQWLMVIPELQLVVAVNSNAWEERPDQANQVHNLIKRFLLPAVPAQ